MYTNPDLAFDNRRINESLSIRRILGHIPPTPPSSNIAYIYSVGSSTDWEKPVGLLWGISKYSSRGHAAADQHQPGRRLRPYILQNAGDGHQEAYPARKEQSLHFLLWGRMRSIATRKQTRNVTEMNKRSEISPSDRFGLIPIIYSFFGFIISHLMENAKYWNNASFQII